MLGVTTGTRQYRGISDRKFALPTQSVLQIGMAKMFPDQLNLALLSNFQEKMFPPDLLVLYLICTSFNLVCAYPIFNINNIFAGQDTNHGAVEHYRKWSVTLTLQ